MRSSAPVLDVYVTVAEDTPSPTDASAKLDVVGNPHIPACHTYRTSCGPSLRVRKPIVLPTYTIVKKVYSFGRLVTHYLLRMLVEMLFQELQRGKVIQGLVGTIGITYLFPVQQFGSDVR